MCPETLPKEVRHVTVDIPITEKSSLVSIWNEMARELKERGCSGAQLITLRQQYFIGAQAYAVILRHAINVDDRSVWSRMDEEIKKNLVDGV